MAAASTALLYNGTRNLWANPKEEKEERKKKMKTKKLFIKISE